MPRASSSYHDAHPSTDSDAPAASRLKAQTHSVLLWGQRCLNSSVVNNVLSECGLIPFPVQSPSAVQQLKKRPNCCAALVGLSADSAPSQDGLDIVRALKQEGFQVISFQDDGRPWALYSQCQALLAGCSWLLDSTRPDFGENLRRLLTHVMQAEAQRADEEESIKGLMERMDIVGESPAMLSVFRVIVRLSLLSDTPALITGETGTGKELLARAIHQLDPKRSNRIILNLNCGAISRELAESELFGHRRGAFTGADRDRKGLFRAAQGGILFLDEVGELEGALQTKLLRVIQENRVLGVGEEQETPVNVRVIAATNRSLGEMVRQGKFREDLFHRLNTLSVHIPPLRERPADLQPLIHHFLKKYRPHETAESPAVGLDFVEALTHIKLPGNVRQLENLIRRALLNKTDNSPLSLGDLPPEVWQELSERGRGSDSTPAGGGEPAGGSSLSSEVQLDLHASLAKLLNQSGWGLSQSLDYCEKLLVESALLLSNDNQSQTARLLGITSRSVYNKVRKHHLNFQ